MFIRSLSQAFVDLKLRGLFLKYASIYVLVVIIAGCGTPIRNLDSQGENIICFGDSITYGEGATEGNYPEYLGQLWNRYVINAGLSGETTADALKRIDDDILSNNPYLVIIEFGGNDFLQHLPRKQTIDNLQEIIARIQGQGAIVALCDLTSGIFLSSYRSDFKSLARKTHSIFIPGVLEGILDNPSLKADNVHPNSKGYSLMAKRIYNVLRKYIK